MLLFLLFIINWVLLLIIMQYFKAALVQSGWIYAGVSPNNGKTEIWQPPNTEVVQ